MDLFGEANKLLNTDRELIYGDAVVNHERIAIIWSALIDADLTGKDVALMMAALKLYRAARNSDHLDSFIDAIAYIDIAAQASSSSSSS
jgi:hypothetical protein